MSTETTCHFGHLLQVSKKSISSLILYIFFHYFIQVYSPGEGLTTPWGWNFDVNRNILSLQSFVASLKKNLFEVWFYTFFSWFYTCIHFNRNVLSLHSFVASFKKMSLKSDFKQFFYDLIHVYSPGAEVDSPQGTNFDVKWKALSLYPFVANFKEISLKSDFIQLFSWFNTYI